MVGGTLKRDFNLSSKEYRGSPPWKISLHPEIRDKACARRFMYRGNRNISWVGLGDFKNSVSTPELLENAIENLNDLPFVGIDRGEVDVASSAQVQVQDQV